MARSLVLLAVAFAVAVVIMSAAVSAQVNFSPSWGKRTPPNVLVQDDLQQMQESCKMPLESIFRIQKLIQAEAQKLVRCQSLSVDSVQRRK